MTFGSVILVGDGRDKALLGNSVGVGDLGGNALELLAVFDQLADTLGLGAQAEGGDGIADEALADHDQRCKDGEVRQLEVIGRTLHGYGGDNAAGEDGRAYNSVVAVDDEAAEEENAEAYRDAADGSDNDSPPLVGEVTQLDGCAHVDKQHADKHRGDVQQRGVGEHGLREQARPEACHEYDRRDKQHRDDCLGLGGNHIAYAENQQDYEGCQYRQHKDSSHSVARIRRAGLYICNGQARLQHFSELLYSTFNQRCDECMILAIHKKFKNFLFREGRRRRFS